MRCTSFSLVQSLEAGKTLEMRSLRTLSMSQHDERSCCLDEDMGLCPSGTEDCGRCDCWLACWFCSGTDDTETTLQYSENMLLWFHRKRCLKTLKVHLWPEICSSEQFTCWYDEADVSLSQSRLLSIFWLDDVVLPLNDTGSPHRLFGFICQTNKWKFPVFEKKK